MFDISMINPWLRVAMESRLPKGITINTRIIYDYELLYLEEGEFVLRYAGADYKCSPGQFLLIRPGVSHSFHLDEMGISQPHVHFDLMSMPDSQDVDVCFTDYKDLSEEERRCIREDAFAQYPQNPMVTFSNKEKALELFYAVVADGTCSTLKQKALFMQLLDMLIIDNFPAAFQKREMWPLAVEVQVKNYIDAGQGMAYRLDDFANQFNYSKYHLERRFKNHYGISLMAYRNEMRLRLAEGMLKSESVSDVAERLGFSTVYVFSRAYKNHYGYSPSEFK